VTADGEATQGRMSRLRQRLSGGFGKSVLGILGGSSISELDWDDAEATLLQADLGLDATKAVLDGLKRATRAHGDVRAALKALLLQELVVDASRELDFTQSPAVVMMVGVNGTGKTTTCGKLAALLQAQGQSVVLGAADTFRAAATQQLQTWGQRVGVPVVVGPEAGDPASVAFDTVARAVDAQASVAIIDTAGRLHTKTGLMDELGKVKRVAAKVRPITDVFCLCWMRRRGRTA
jgi:fused signal recognition particle receptor